MKIHCETTRLRIHRLIYVVNSRWSVASMQDSIAAEGVRVSFTRVRDVTQVVRVALNTSRDVRNIVRVSEFGKNKKAILTIRVWR